jgi:hypothetical protein
MEFCDLLLLTPESRSEAGAELLARWRHAALSVVNPNLAMALATGCGASTPEVIDMTRDEFAAAAEASLEQLGLTYQQLEEQARSGDFASPTARSLWVVIGAGYGE